MSRPTPTAARVKRRALILAHAALLAAFAIAIFAHAAQVAARPAPAEWRAF